MDCQEVLDQLADYLDEDARAELCKVIEEHLKGCSNCQIYVDSVKKTIVLYQADDKSQRLEMSMQVNDRLHARLAEAYRCEPATLEGSDTAGVSATRRDPETTPSD